MAPFKPYFDTNYELEILKRRRALWILLSLLGAALLLGVFVIGGPNDGNLKFLYWVGVVAGAISCVVGLSNTHRVVAAKAFVLTNQSNRPVATLWGDYAGANLCLWDNSGKERFFVSVEPRCLFGEVLKTVKGDRIFPEPTEDKPLLHVWGAAIGYEPGYKCGWSLDVILRPDGSHHVQHSEWERTEE